MLTKLLIFNTIFITFFFDKISTEHLNYKEQQSVANAYLKIYIKRFELIVDKQVREIEGLLNNQNDLKEADRVYNEKDKFKYELNLLKATFEMALTNHTIAEKLNFLYNFPKLIPAYFSSFLMDELDMQYIDQKIRLDLKYLNLMKEDLQQLSLNEEALCIETKLKETLLLNILPKKLQDYKNITETLTPEFQHILDRQPLHKIILKAHLNFLNEYVNSFEESEIEEFKPYYNVMLRQLENAQDSTDEGDKFKFLKMFNNVTTKFGRFLKIKFEEYKFKFSNGLGN